MYLEVPHIAKLVELQEDDALDAYRALEAYLRGGDAIGHLHGCADELRHDDRMLENEVNNRLRSRVRNRPVVCQILHHWAERRV